MSKLAPLQVLEEAGQHETTGKSKEWNVWEFQLTGRSDPLLVIPLDDDQSTGMITYVKQSNGETSYVHTLKSPSGFCRKLQAIGILVQDTGSIDYVGLPEE